MNKSTVSVIKLVKISYFVIILLSQTVVRIISRQPFFFIICYSFPTYLTFLSNRKPVEPKFYGYLTFGHKLSCDNKSIFRLYYSTIVATLPDPTVRPPSRIAKLRPCSIATGWINSIVISTLSPGIHISTPSGSSQTPVTSVVLK